MKLLNIKVVVNTFLLTLLLAGFSTSNGSTDTPIVKDTTVIVDSVTNLDGKKLCGLNEWIIVYVNELEKFLQTTKGKSPVLFINGMPLTDCRSLIVNTTRNELRFFLKRTDSTKAIWNTILGKPSGLTKFVSLSIGPKNGPQIPSKENNFTLIIIRRWQFWVFVPFLIVFLVAIFLLFKKTNLLRDSPTLFVPETRSRTFSLARAQILFWTVIVLASFVFIWVATGDVNTITDSVLILIGISSATALGARAIDSTNAAHDALDDAKDGTKRTERTKFETTTNSFWKDLLGGNSDDGIHRLQIIVWTIILGIIFICSVWLDLTMPDFNGTLLTMMGISSGTYIGFKMKE